MYKPGIPIPVPAIKLSYFKPEFASKLHEDAEAHLLGTIDWMDTHAFPEGAEFQRFCLTSDSKTRLWYELHRCIAATWNIFSRSFRQQYSRIGNTREQLFHAWRSLHFDKHSETTDKYVTHFRQVGGLLGYGEPQVLEVFKDTLTSRLYWVHFL